MKPRHARALAVGAAAAVAYLGGARLGDAVPVRPMALAAMATFTLTQLFGGSGCAKAYTLENRLAGPFTFQGDIYMQGHNVRLQGGSVVP